VSVAKELRGFYLGRYKATVSLHRGQSAGDVRTWSIPLPGSQYITPSLTQPRRVYMFVRQMQQAGSCSTPSAQQRQTCGVTSGTIGPKQRAVKISYDPAVERESKYL
jgi:hypothetical protein